MRDRGGSARRGGRDREQSQNSTAYTKYKTNLERLFSGGGASLPEHLREKADPPGEQTERDEERKKLYAVEDPKEFYAAATEFLRKNDLPDDARLLDRLLGTPGEGLMEEALSRLG